VRNLRLQKYLSSGGFNRQVVKKRGKALVTAKRKESSHKRKNRVIATKRVAKKDVSVTAEKRGPHLSPCQKGSTAARRKKSEEGVFIIARYEKAPQRGLLGQKRGMHHA